MRNFCLQKCHSYPSFPCSPSPSPSFPSLVRFILVSRVIRKEPLYEISKSNQRPTNGNSNNSWYSSWYPKMYLSHLQMDVSMSVHLHNTNVSFAVSQYNKTQNTSWRIIISWTAHCDSLTLTFETNLNCWYFFIISPSSYNSPKTWLLWFSTILTQQATSCLFPENKQSTTFLHISLIWKNYFKSSSLEFCTQHVFTLIKFIQESLAEPLEILKAMLSWRTLPPEWVKGQYLSLLHSDWLRDTLILWAQRAASSIKFN